MTRTLHSPLGHDAGGGAPLLRRRPPAARRRAAGLSLVEVLVASAVLGTVVVAATHSLTATVTMQDVTQERPTTAFELAREMFRIAQTLEQAPGDGQPATRPDELVLLEDLDGASFSPPLDGRKQEQTGLSDWTQRTFLRRVDLADPTTTDDEGQLHELTVVVDEGQDTVGSYRWWLPADADAD